MHTDLKRKRQSVEVAQTDPVNERTSKRVLPESPEPNVDNAEIQLPQLLDCSSLTSPETIENRFNIIANALLHDFHVVISLGSTVTRFEILELEFYLYKPDCHVDPFTHGSEEQRRSGQWHFHRAPRRSLDSRTSLTSAAGYRGGSRKGLDLTLGGPMTSPYFSAESSTLRGGILLRTLRRTTDSKVISGPSLLVDEILRLNNASSISTLVQQKWGGDITAFASASSQTRAASMRMVQIPPALRGQDRPHVYRSPRIGLDLAHPGTTCSLTHPRVMFVSKAYRYFVRPQLLTSNGRSQTFLGVYRACLEAKRYDRSDREFMEEIANLAGLKGQTVTKYLADYEAGVSGGDLKSFIGPAGKGAASSPATYLRMIGILVRIQQSSPTSS